MSTDRKRLQSAIQRIAREDPQIRKLLEDYRNAGGFPSESASSESGGDDRNICCDGSSSGKTNPGSDTKYPSEGGQDAGDGLDPGDPARLDDMGPGSLTGVKDCANGEPVCFEGSDWVPPDGWESPTDPPVDETYEEGYFWVVNWVSPTGSGEDYSAGRPSVCGYTGCDGVSCDSSTGSFVEQCDDGTYSAGRERQTCPDSGTDADIDAVCSGDPPTESFWPSDGCTNLAIKGGKIVGSKFDPENDGSYSKPRNSIELCDDYGNSFTLAPSASGGWKSISAQNPGDGYLYNSRGEQIARISGSEFSDPKV